MSDANVGECRSGTAFWIDEGFHVDTDLSGLAFVLYNFFPPKMSSGDWHVGLAVDGKASEERALAVEKIISGRAGGPFGPLTGLVGEYFGLEYAEIVFRGTAERPNVWIDKRGAFQFEPALDGRGEPVAARNAMFPFATNFVVGKTTGEHRAYGEAWSASYGEYARFSFGEETMSIEQGLGRGPSR
jgi:hypothetical protein